MSLTRRLLALVFFCLSASMAQAATINVGPGQVYTKIQAGIDAASAGDTVLVAPGIYYENIDFVAKAITVTSSGGPTVTIIDGGGVNPATTVRFHSGELRTSVLSGFTIRGGNAPQAYYLQGGGVFVYNSAPTIVNNVITANVCNDVLVNNGAPLIQGNTITNVLPASPLLCVGPPAGVLVYGNGTVGVYSHTDMIGNDIENNAGDGIALDVSENTIIQGNTIANNRGGHGGLWMFQTHGINVLENLLFGNVALPVGSTTGGVPSGILLQPENNGVGPFLGLVAGNTIADGLTLVGDSSRYLMINNIITNSSATTPPMQCSYTAGLTPPSLDHNDIYNSAGAAYGSGCPDQTGTFGNVSVDPQFASPASGNYQLTVKSPLLDAGNNSAPQLPALDFAGTARVQRSTSLGYPVVDIGAYEYAGAPDAGHTVVSLTPSEYFASANPSPAPPPLSLTIQLSSAVGQPTGFAAIYEDGTLLSTVSVGTTGSVTVTPNNLQSGTHSFTAVYPAPNSGTVNAPAFFTPAVSPRFFLLVPKAAGSITLSAAPNPSAYGTPVTVTAQTTANAVVTLTDTSTNTVLATGAATSQGVLAYTVSTLAPGIHVIQAATGGLSETVSQLVLPIPTSSTLAVTSPPSGPYSAGTPVTLTATIVATASTATGPTGTVSFYNGTTILGTGTVLSTRASVQVTLPAGNDSLSCQYSGDSNFAPSTCGTVMLAVNGSLQSQTISFPAVATPAYAATAVALNASASSGLPVTYSVVSGPATVVGSTLTYTGAGTVVLEADQAGNGSYSAAPPVQQKVTVTILTEPLTLASPPVTTLVTFLSAGTLGSLNVSTQGAAGLDFNLAGGGTCSVGASYTAGQTCTVNFTFTPLHPGLRYGGIALATSGGSLLANSYLLGLGTGPQVLYNPPNQTLVGTGFGGLSGVAVDGSGNLYASDYVNGGVFEVMAATGTTRLLAQTAPATDVAVDGSGNVFFTTRSIAGEILAVNGVIPAVPTVRTLAAGYIAINGMKVDATGNVFIASGDGGGGNSFIEELIAVNGSIPAVPVIRTLVSNVGAPTGVAIDVVGNVYFSDGINNDVDELVAVGGSIPASPTLRVVSSTIGQPTNVAFDVSGNLYVPDAGTHDVKELLAVNLVLPSSPVMLSLGSGLLTPAGVTIDSGGSLFVADLGVNQVVKLAYGSAPTLTFAPTRVGATSSDSPQTVTITNGGNAPLVIAPPATGTNAAISGNFSVGSASTCPTLTPGATAYGLPAGASCTTAVSFTPASVGNLTGTLVRTDNNLGVAGATQTILLNGVGLGIAPVIVFTVGNHTFGDAPFAVGATSNSPGTFTYSVVSGPASIAGTTVTLTGAGTVVLQASQAASGLYAAGTATASFAVAKLGQTITFVQPGSPVALGAGPVTLVASASSGLPVSFTIVSGPGQVSGNTLTVKGGGTIVIAADQAGNGNYTAAVEVTRSVVVLYGLATVTLTGAPNPVFLHNPVVLAATIAGAGGAPGGSVSFMEAGTVLGSAVISGGAAAISVATLGVGPHTITAVYGGDVNFAGATSPSIVIVVQDFSLTIANPNVTIQHGGTAVYNVVVSSVGGVGLASNISLTFSGGPDRSVSVITPASVATGSGTTAATLTMQTPNYPTGPFYPGLVFGVLLLPVVRKRRRLRSLVMMVLGLVLLAAATGCGSGWKTQHFSVTVTATSGQLVRSAAATLTSVP